MQHSTLRVRILEAPCNPNGLLVFACLSRVLTIKQRLHLIRIVTIQYAPLLAPRGGSNGLS